MLLLYYNIIKLFKIIKVIYLKSIYNNKAYKFIQYRCINLLQIVMYI